jgi:hypothetical protein
MESLYHRRAIISGLNRKGKICRNMPVFSDHCKSLHVKLYARVVLAETQVEVKKSCTHTIGAVSITTQNQIGCLVIDARSALFVSAHFSRTHLC